MASVPETDQKYLQRRAQEVGGLLSEVLRGLRFYAGAGYSGGDCSNVNLERLRQWNDPDCLRFYDGPAVTATDLVGCEGCALRASRKPVIAGPGPAAKKLMFVIGYPSFSTDTEKTPFAGEAGQLLSKIISAMTLKPDDVYVSHIVKCRPPEGREPSAEETRCCLPLLEREITAVAPDVICALGEFAARTLLNSPEPLERLRGRFQDRHGVRIMATWHPDDMIDDPDKKRPVWEDIRKVMSCLDIA